METTQQRLPGDRVEAWDPITFAVAFTRTMRKQKGVATIPSLRTSLAIPRFLSARWARVRALTLNDYLAAAVLNTPLEDQALAEVVATALLFPQKDEATARAAARASARDHAEAAGAGGGDADDASALDILGDLAALDVDLDALDDLSDLDALLEDEEAEEGGPMQAFDLFERLYASAEPEERALGELIALFDGPADLDARGVRAEAQARLVILGHLQARVGELTPDMVRYACQAGFGEALARAVTLPWELAGVLAGEGDLEGLDAHLDDLLSEGTDHDRGRTLSFLRPHGVEASSFVTASLALAGDLAGFAQLAVGLGAWLEPPAGLLASSARDNPRRALEAAIWLDRHLGHDLREPVIEAWADGLEATPTLEALTRLAVDCPRWRALADAAYREQVAALDQAVPALVADADAPVVDARVDEAQREVQPLPAALLEAIDAATALEGCGLKAASRHAAALAGEVLTRVRVSEAFLPTLDVLLERGVVPAAIDAVVVAARRLGIHPGEVYDRIGDAVDQLRTLVLADATDADRYRRLVERIARLSPDLVSQLTQRAIASGNLEAMAALLAIDLSGASALAPQGFVMQALGHRGIGGGSNLLVSWFNHRERLPDALRDQVRVVARAALLDQAFDWIGKGDGSTSRGLIPQSTARPFRPGDGLDAMDIEATLDAVVSAGRPLDQITSEDLYVQDQARGMAAFTVLIDISGSMSGSQLAICAVAVVMLLGKLKPSEIALAVFESDTHVIKNLTDDVDLDGVADAVLDLQARGGTRVEAALRWAREQFEAATEASVRQLFLLSDFAFWEQEAVLLQSAAPLADLGVGLLAASHGYVNKRVLETMVSAIGGEHLKLSDLNKLPSILLATLSRIADGGVV